MHSGIFRKSHRGLRSKVMDSRDSYSYMDLRTQFSTRRYTYEGHGGQKHDKTLILHKSESCSNDTIVLRLCKRSCGRMTWSSCVKGKLILAVLMALMALFCYFNLFSSYLPKTCHIFAVRSSQALKSVPNETVYVRTRNALSEHIFGINSRLAQNSELVSTFRKKVAMEMQGKTIFSTTVLQHVEGYQYDPSTVIKQLSVTSSPDMRSPNTPRKVMDALRGTEEAFIVRIHHSELSEFDLPQKGEITLISRIMKSSKSPNVV